MPKKTRKMKQRAALRRNVDAAPSMQVVEETEDSFAGEPVAATVRPTLAASNARALSPAAYDYTYIYSDLKRIALFAGFFFMVLIALSFVIK